MNYLLTIISLLFKGFRLPEKMKKFTFENSAKNSKRGMNT